MDLYFLDSGNVLKCPYLRIAGIALLMLSTFTVGAEDAFPSKGEFTLVAGAYEVTISATYAYTIRSIAFDGELLGAPTGFYGTVIAPESGKYIGAGHKEGGVEKVENIEFEVDGKKTAPETGGRYTGESIMLRKISCLDNLRFEITIELSPHALIESKSYEAVSDQRIHLFALYAYCWNVSTREWIAELPDGKIMQGVFRDDGSWHLKEEIKWAALYDPVAEKGMLMYHPRVIPGALRKTAFWDVDKRYHKYDVFLKTAPVIPKGEKSDTYILIAKGFSSQPSDWKEQVRKIANELKSGR